MTPAPTTSPATHAAVAPTTASFAGLVSFLLGGFGVLSGFAIFFLMLEKAEKPFLFLVVLGVASVLSALFETLKELIEHPRAAGHGQRSTVRIFVFLIIIAAAEFHVMSWEAFLQVSNSHDFATVIFSLLGSSMTGSAGVFLDLAVQSGFWVFSGAVLAVSLLAQLNTSTGSLPARIFRGGGIGALTGALAAPLCLLGYVVFVWLVRGLYLLVCQPQIWKSNVATLRDVAAGGHSAIHTVFSLTLSGILWLVSLFGGHPLGPVAVVALAVIVLLVLAKSDATLPALIVGGALVAVVIAPLWGHSGAVPVMLLRASLVWVVPGLVLGAMSPLLRETSQEQKPKSWALVSFASAAVLFVITLLRFEHSWWLLLPVALFVAMGFALRRAPQADAYWLPVAAAVSVLVCGTMLGVQRTASFAGVYDSMHGIMSLPSQLAPVPPRALSPVERDFASAVSTLQSQVASLYGGSASLLTIEERVRRARELAGKLDSLRHTVDDRKIDPAAWTKKMADCATAARHLEENAAANRFERMTATITVHQQLYALQRETEVGMRVPLQNLRGQIEAIKPPPIRITELTLSSRNPPESAPQQEMIRLETAVRTARESLLKQIDGRILAVEEIGKQLGEIERPVDKLERETRDLIMRWLELAIAGSVGYWTAISLLVGWSIRLREAAPALPDSGSGTTSGPPPPHGDA